MSKVLSSIRGDADAQGLFSKLLLLFQRADRANIFLQNMPY